MSARIVDGTASATANLVARKQRLHALSLSRPNELKLRLIVHRLFNPQPSDSSNTVAFVVEDQDVG